MRILFVILSSVLFLIASVEVALAKERETTSVTAIALRMGRAALKDFEAENWQSALTGFIEADHLAHSPVFELYIARCLKFLGHWFDARRHLENVIDEEIPITSPSPWSEARDTAKLELSKLVNDIPKIDIELSGQNAPRVLLLLDGKPISTNPELSTQRLTRLELDPGHHELLVQFDNQTLESRSFVLEPGDPPFVITLGPYEQTSTKPIAANPNDQFLIVSPGSVISSTVKVTPKRVIFPSAATRHSPPRSIPKGAYVALGFGILGTCLGAVTGILALHKRNEIVENCDGMSCSRQFASTIDRAKQYGNISTAAFTSAGVGFAAAGLIIYAQPSAFSSGGSFSFDLSGRF
jgi:hypothetical protein